MTHGYNSTQTNNGIRPIVPTSQTTEWLL